MTNLIKNDVLLHEFAELDAPKSTHLDMNVINLVKFYCGLEAMPLNADSQLDLMQFLANSCSFRRLTFALVQLTSEVT